MKKTLIIALLTICSFTAANCQIVETINGFEIIELRRSNDYQQRYFTVPKLYKYLENRRIEMSISNVRIDNLESADLFETDFQHSNLEIEDYFNGRFDDILERKGMFLIFKTDECLIRFERDENAKFNVECDCVEL